MYNTATNNTDVLDLFPFKVLCSEMCKHESIPGTPEPLHTRVPEWQFIAYDNVFSSFPGVRGIDQAQKYSKGARGIQISKKKGIRSSISVVAHSHHSVCPHITFLTNKASLAALLAIESRECYQHHYPRLIGRRG